MASQDLRPIRSMRTPTSVGALGCRAAAVLPQAWPKINSIVTPKRPSRRAASKRRSNASQRRLPVNPRRRPAATLTAPAGPQIKEQRGQIRIAQLNPVHVHDWLGEPRREREIAEIVHIEKRVDVDPIVDGGPSPPNLLERVGSERCEGQQTRPASRPSPPHETPHPVGTTATAGSRRRARRCATAAAALAHRRRRARSTRRRPRGRARRRASRG